MKKFIILLILFFFLILISPLLGEGGIYGPNECCQLDHDLRGVDPMCTSDTIVGPKEPKWCDVDGDGKMKGKEESPTSTPKWATCCFLDSVYTISDWLFMVFLAFTLIMFAIAGYLFLFSGGVPQNIEKARNYIFWAAIAMALVLLSKLIPAIIRAIVT
jgi:hypothetical protein